MMLLRILKKTNLYGGKGHVKIHANKMHYVPNKFSFNPINSNMHAKIENDEFALHENN